MNLLLFLALACLVSIIVFIFQNPTAVVVKFIIWNTQEMSLGLIVLAAACIGAFLVFCLYLYHTFRSRRATAQLQKERDVLQERLLIVENKLRWYEEEQQKAKTVTVEPAVPTAPVAELGDKA